MCPLTWRRTFAGDKTKIASAAYETIAAYGPFAAGPAPTFGLRPNEKHPAGNDRARKGDRRPKWRAPARRKCVHPGKRGKVRDGDGARLRTLPCGQLARIQASGKNCLATDFEGQEYYLDRSLRYYSERLDPAVFFQINRQLLIHVESLVELIPYSKSRYKLVLAPPLREAAIVSVERSARFKQWLEGS